MKLGFRILAAASIFLILVGCFNKDSGLGAPKFDGQRAYQHVVTQMNFGPRVPGSEGHEKTRDWLIEELLQAGWNVEVQQGEFLGRKFYNIAADKPTLETNESEWILLGAHYDTRPISDKDEDPNLRIIPVPGANDGASGVAVLLELARVLPELYNLEISLVFFDMEDGGGIPDGEWIIGSNAYAVSLDSLPDAVVIVDMIGDGDQNIYLEKSSDPILSAEIWRTAKRLGINTFIDEEKYHILDDHTPFLMRGVPSVDIIDFDYPAWHTTQDTLDKVSVESLQNVGDVLLEWLLWKDVQP